MANDGKPTIETVKARLNEIASLVSDDSMSIDEALGLYEEAVNLSLVACDLTGESVASEEGAQEATSDTEAAGITASGAAEGASCEKGADEHNGVSALEG